MAWRRRFLAGLTAVVLTGCAVSPTVVATSTSSPSSTALAPAPSTASVPPKPSMRIELALAQLYQQRLDQGVTDLLIPGAIVGIRTPQGLWVGTSGTAQPGAVVPIERDSTTRIGSVTKTFTATIVLQLSAEKLLSLDATVGSYFPTMPNADATIRQLLLMRYGVPSPEGTEDFAREFTANPTKLYSRDDILARIQASAPVDRPGSAFLYSNANFVLLGAIAEKVTGRSFDELVAERILRPLQLEHTHVAPGSVLPAPALHGQTDIDGVIHLDVSTWSTSMYGPAGTMVSTVDDMLIWAEALGTGRDLLPPAFQQERLDAMQHNIAGYNTRFGYSYGLMQRGSWIGHSGLVDGYSTWIGYNPSTQMSVVVLTNSSIFPTNRPPAEALLDWLEPILS